MASRLTLPWSKIPATWNEDVARNIQQNFEALKSAILALQGTTAEVIDVQGTPGPRGPQGLTGLDGIDGSDGMDGFPGVAGAQGAQGPAGPTGPQGPPGTGGGAGLPMVPLSFPDSFIDNELEEIMNEALIPPPGVQIGAQSQSATVSWGTPTLLSFGVNFTQTTDGVILLYNSVSQSGTLAYGGVTVGGVSTNQSDTALFPYKNGTTANITAGGAGSGLLAWYFPFTGGAGWGTTSTPAIGSNFTETSDGMVLLYNTNNEVATYTLAGTVYGRVNGGTNDTACLPYKNGETAIITVTSGTGLTATFYPFTGNGGWGTPVSASTATDFTETASGLLIVDNTGNQGGLILLNASAYGGANNSVNDTGMVPYTVGQTAHINLVGGSGLNAWFFPLPSAGSSSGTTITGGNFSTNVTGTTIGSPVVFADSSGRLGTSTANLLCLTGSGTPQGNVAAPIGYWYFDTATGNAWRKVGGGSTKYGWYLLPQLGAGMAQQPIWGAWTVNQAGVTAGTSAIFGGAGDGFFQSGTATAALTPSGITTQSFTITNGKVYPTATSAATSGTVMYIATGASTQANQMKFLDDSFDLTVEFMTGSAITTVRFWGIAIASNNMTNSSTWNSAANVLGIRFDTSVPDGGWVGFTDAAGTSNVTGTLANGTVTASTVYRLRIRFVRSGTPTVYYSVNDGTETAVTANIPATGVAYAVFSGLTCLANAARTFSVRTLSATWG